MTVATFPGRLASNYADVILVGGKIITVDKKFSIAEAIAIRNGRFIAVGSRADIEELAGPSTRCIDLSGATVLPGLTDTHVHVEMIGLRKFTASFDRARTVADALDRIAARVARTPRGGWIRGTMWHPIAQLKERRYLTLAELDSVARDHPVVLPIGHFSMVNSRALEAAGITAATRDPAGGVIHRDTHTGEPTGLLEESAEEMVLKLLPDWSLEERIAQLEDAQAVCNELGITSAISAAVDPVTFRAHQEICRTDRQTLRISAMFAPTGRLNPSMTVEEWELFFSRIGAVSDFGNEWLSYSGVKLQIDGGMTLRTALMRDGYPDDRNYKGTFVIEPERFEKLVAIANRYGWRVGVHAVGDAAIDRVLNAYERADAERSIRGRRFVVIHGSLIQRDQMERAKALDVRVDAQTAFLWDKGPAISKYLGKSTADRAFPMRTMLDVMGLDLIGQGTDFPINSLNPFINIYTMVTRRDKNGDTYGSDEKITREEAIRLYTSAAVRYAFWENNLGSIELGKLADLIVLSDDILTVPEEAIKEISVTKAFVGGRQVFEKK
jgi:predicted amidohydrolase YtcJ